MSSIMRIGEVIKTVIKTVIKIGSLSRVFYIHSCLYTFFPFYMILFNSNYITSFWSILLIAPFFFTMSAGYVYNAICDSDMDPPEKNLITRGEITKNNAYIILGAIVSLSLLSFLYFYNSTIALLAYIAYVLLWLAYSGLNIRFKESYLAPIVASIVLWTGAPFILLLECNCFTPSIILLLLGIFITHVGQEIKHTILEYDLDLSFNCETFAVKFGQKNASLAEYFFIIMGYACYLFSAYYFLDKTINILVWITSLLFAISLASTVLYGYSINFKATQRRIFTTLPYLTSRLFFVGYGFSVLGLPLLLLFFALWTLIE